MFGKGESCLDQDKPANLPREWKRGGNIIDWIKENDIKFVLMMGYNDAGRMRIIRWCHKQHVPCFMFGDSNIHGDTRRGIKSVIKKLIVTRIVKSCTGILACGTLGKAYFEKYGARPERIFYFPYEPDYQLLAALSDPFISQVRQRFGLNPGVAGSFTLDDWSAFKRVDLLFNAFLTIAVDRPEWDLVIVGDGPDRKQLEAMVPSELSSRVVWAGFVDDQAVVSAVYRASDLLVLPSDFEPWALVINEAAAAGLAIIASNVVGAAAELVREGVNGKLFPPGDLEALTRAMLQATDSAAIDRLKAGSEPVLAAWRRLGDPVQGLRNALGSAGL